MGTLKLIIQLNILTTALSHDYFISGHNKLKCAGISSYMIQPSTFPFSPNVFFFKSLVTFKIYTSLKRHHQIPCDRPNV